MDCNSIDTKYLFTILENGLMTPADQEFIEDDASECSA
jgi:hypothetical protein